MQHMTVTLSVHLLLLPALSGLLGSSAAAQTASQFPTHCASDEFAYLNAKMSRVDHDEKGQTVLTKNGKVLSLCADKASEPYGRFTYRYGAIGNVEMERSASGRNKFRIYSRSSSPHTGEDLVFFSVGKLTYYVTKATAQGNGVSLHVLESRRRIVYLYSGPHLGIDFEFGPAGVNFYRSASPLFYIQEPPDSF